MNKYFCVKVVWNSFFMILIFADCMCERVCERRCSVSKMNNILCESCVKQHFSAPVWKYKLVWQNVWNGILIQQWTICCVKVVWSNILQFLHSAIYIYVGVKVAMCEPFSVFAEPSVRVCAKYHVALLKSNILCES